MRFSDLTLSFLRKEKVATFSWDDLDVGRRPEVDVTIYLAVKAHDIKNKADSEVYFNINIH